METPVAPISLAKRGRRGIMRLTLNMVRRAVAQRRK